MPSGCFAGSPAMNGTSPLASTASWPHARSRWAAQAIRAALIPIRKFEAWWDLAQDERRLIGGYLRLPGYGGEERDDVVGERLGPRYLQSAGFVLAGARRGRCRGLALRPAATRRRPASGDGRHAAAAPAAHGTGPGQREAVAERAICPHRLPPPRS